ncbi:hypothetical protein C8R43DRAFT_1125780 [Mycena crocata]|nr:hypothetical protein C8R43DRAFT_1125780 [Mycena crocata]
MASPVCFSWGGRERVSTQSTVDGFLARLERSRRVPLNVALNGRDSLVPQTLGPLFSQANRWGTLRITAPEVIHRDQDGDEHDLLHFMEQLPGRLALLRELTIKGDHNLHEGDLWFHTGAIQQHNKLGVGSTRGLSVEDVPFLDAVLLAHLALVPLQLEEFRVEAAHGFPPSPMRDYVIDHTDTWWDQFVQMLDLQFKRGQILRVLDLRPSSYSGGLRACVFPEERHGFMHDFQLDLEKTNRHLLWHKPSGLYPNSYACNGFRFPTENNSDDE